MAVLAVSGLAVLGLVWAALVVRADKAGWVGMGAPLSLLVVAVAACLALATAIAGTT